MCHRVDPSTPESCLRAPVLALERSIRPSMFYMFVHAGGRRSAEPTTFLNHPRQRWVQKCVTPPYALLV